MAERPGRRALRAARRGLDALAGPNGIDPFLVHLDRTWSGHDLRGRVVDVAHPSPDSVTLTIRPNRAWPGFRAGQHLAVAVEIDGVQHHRCFSPTSSQHRSDAFELTVKAHPDGLVARHLKDHGRPGDVLGLTEPTGTFTLPDAPHRPGNLLFVSGGSGHTPILSMLRTLADERHAGALTWLHYDRTPVDVAVDDAEIRRLRHALPGLRTFRAHTGAAGAGDLDGHISPTHLAHVEPAWRDRPTWACGPPSLLAALRDLHDDNGTGDLLHTEAFTLDAHTGVGTGAGSVGGTIALRRSHLSLVDDGRPLLVQAEDAGLSPAHGCRMGICRTCTTPLVAGTVRDAVTGETTSATNDPAGCGVRLCVSVPVGDVALDL